MAPARGRPSRDRRAPRAIGRRQKAPLRHRQFFSLAEANAALAEKIEEWNNRNNDIQLDIFYDYRTNLPLYPKVQEYLRKHQPPTLIVWGKNDFIFPADGAHPYNRDLTDLEFHLLDTGHFVLEDKADEVFPLIKDFLNRKLRGG